MWWVDVQPAFLQQPCKAVMSVWNIWILQNIWTWNLDEDGSEDKRGSHWVIEWHPLVRACTCMNEWINGFVRCFGVPWRCWKALYKCSVFSIYWLKGANLHIYIYIYFLWMTKHFKDGIKQLKNKQKDKKRDFFKHTPPFIGKFIVSTII